MPSHFNRFVADGNSPGVILLRKGIHISGAIDDLVLIWSASDSDEWINRLVWIPY